MSGLQLFVRFGDIGINIFLKVVCLIIYPANVNGPRFRVWEGVWIALLGEIWKHKNMRVFRNERADYLEIFVVVQRKTWVWIKEKFVEFSYSEWCMEPLECMKYVKK